MRWVAPTEKDTANEVLEKHLWAAADHFRANSGLKAGWYSTPVLGLIFLRFAEARFAHQRAQFEKADAATAIGFQGAREAEIRSVENARRRTRRG
ncbi:MAG: type I restriction-modification system subunit M N-terminal domain-containing protein [Burkholderiales bacterium]